MMTQLSHSPQSLGSINRLIRFFLENKLVVFLLLGLIGLWGYRVMPFRTSDSIIPRDPIPVDAFPDIGENQQIVFTDWPGRSPQEIKTEDNFLVSYVLFDKRPDHAEVDAMEEAARLIQYKIEQGELKLPAGVHYQFAGSYENQVRFQKRLRIILPLSLFLLFLLLYFQFRSVPISLIVFSGIPVAWAGGFIGLWFIAQPWFLNFDIFEYSVRELFNFTNYNLSVAVWVGFIALFSVTTDDGVVMATYLGHEFDRTKINSVDDIRAAVILAGTKRVRPCLMTSATTVLSLMPVLTSSGRGVDVMIPIALPSIGGLSIELLSLFILPVTYCFYKEIRWKLQGPQEHAPF